MFQIYQLSDDGYEMSLGYYLTEHEAEEEAEAEQEEEQFEEKGLTRFSYDPDFV